MIIVTMANGAGTFTYMVSRTIIVDDTEYAAVIPTVDPGVATLTLATCHPKFTSDDRMIVQAALVPEQSSQVFAPPPNTVPTQPDPTLPAEEPPTTHTDVTSKTGETVAAPAGTTTTSPAVAVNTITEDGLSGGWFDDSAAIPDVVLWGLLLLAVGIGSYYVGRACKRLYVSFLIGFIPFVIVLYFFFQNLNRLLPPGL